MTDISVIGLGNMGAALAATLLKSGRSVTVWNRSPDKAADLVARGATLAASVEDAVGASPATLTCLQTHETTHDLLAPLGPALAGKVVLDLSTGGAEEAEALVAMLTGAGATWQIGMINAYPSGIGQDETAILCAGPEEVWRDWGPAIRALGGASAHVGTEPSAVPALFAAMFTARQGFMFGLIYGGALCRKAGLPMESFAAQIPVTHGVAGNYGKLFARTVPGRDYDNAEATMEVYLRALDDVMATFKATGTSDAFPRLMRDLTQKALDGGEAGRQLTALVEMLAEDRV
ncbi:NAD(P)-dependent oxidoreductase [Aestuariicoccus sp. MJ-SS9]|uniref:NAD(P)-dependent oxidoreductase n=1 Tax=Aestuariicoccus sp. MJ-SS9 TaxID=3079855 RepID=UPI00290F9434|nr:NAD(P)-binding domain-containing protein [Aestuariicoccus sp. MJ-SS9]MDU8912596.1 NAD(P)-binding domain-containing protein [Aestuariicoccus sp. MJ-SS9]